MEAKNMDEQAIRHGIKVLDESIRSMTKHRNSLKALLSRDLPQARNTKLFKPPCLRKEGE